ncbi:MAG TPA: nitroreductase family protein [Caldisericia bacterium]|nr:nitroreductase family protein [Caldisericia bacterium]HPC56288.1 nitroreductase family protein [Caldisericia bacterium]
MNDILEIIKSRRSIRNYKNEKIKDEEILKIVEAGRWAPSASNNQPWRFIIVQNVELIKKIGDACKILTINSFVEKAPLIIIIYTEKKHRWVELDCGICAENMMLEAHSIGIGSCFVGAFKENKIKEIINLPEDFNVVGLITFGYKENEKEPTLRLDLKDIVKYDFYTKDKTKIVSKKSIKSGFLSIISTFFKKR